MIRHGQLIGGILLVAGTTIGAAMLALPVVTGLAGFVPSAALFVAYWVYMTFTALLMLETNLWMPPGTNLISMAKNTLGPWGEGLSWAAYLFLLYSLTTAYIAGSGSIVIDFVQAVSGIAMPEWLGTIPLLAIFGFFVYKGTRSVDLVNRLLMGGLVLTYSLMVIFLTPHVKIELLKHADWHYLPMAISVAATSFGFHIIIPSLSTYFDRDVEKLKKAILIGSVIPLVVYILWEMLTLGIIPLNGPNGLVEGFAKGANGAHLLTAEIGNPAIAMIARCFSFFAIVTSFLGVSLSLSDFLADGFKIEKSGKGRALLFVMTFLPPLAITLSNPRAFLVALDYAGAFGVVLLLGLIPALMVWKGRSSGRFKSLFKAPGGKTALLATMAVSVMVIAVVVYNKLWT